MTSQFIHLNVHSDYSIQEGLLRVKELVTQTLQHRKPAVALTDLSNGFGWVKFYRAAIASGIKPLLGVQLLLDHDGVVSRFELLCLNQTGYSNLKKLLSYVYQNRSDTATQVVVSWATLAEHHEGFVALSGGLQGDIAQAIQAHDSETATARCQRWHQLFGDRFYLELQRLGLPGEEDVIRHSLAWSAQHAIAVVATNAVCFLKPDDFQAHEARVCINRGEILDDPQRQQLYSPEQYLKSPQEMFELFIDIPEAIENTWYLAQRCTVTLEMDVIHLPSFPVQSEMTEASYLRQLAEQGLQAYCDKISMAEEARLNYQARLSMELGVIETMGYSGYFLIVADFIGWAKKQAIPVGPGRGSGAGSLVAFVLKITTLDPLEHDLLFERFLNPERVSLPDFDVDFCMDKRDRVIDYVVKRYGQESVAQIITYGTMAAKAVVRDVGRVLGMPYGFVDKLAKLIPFEIGMTLSTALSQEERLQERYDSEPEVTTLIDLAKRLEGLTRHAGRHAGGVVIAPLALHNFVPLYRELNDDHLVTQFDKDDLETVGLVKFDFLGLRTLTIIQWTLDQVNRALPQDEHIDIDDIPLDDESTFQLLKRCATMAVFQLESRGMTDLVRRLQPDCFDDLVALVALFRPGPLQSGMVDDFVDRKHGRSKVVYAHPALEPILSETYGVILYQEQVMQIAQSLAGYSLGHADILRRAMGKKKPEEMARQREIFVKGAVENEVPEQTAKYIFDLMEKFAGYGFNKSHSAAYATISYQTAWLKAHFPAEFMAAVLSSDMDNTDKVVGFVAECRQMDLAVVFPDIQKSRYRFSVNKAREIVYGLGAIKGVGQSAIDSIIAAREEGPFQDFCEFCERVDVRRVNRRVLEALILAGACDCFAVSREVLHASIETVLKVVEQKHRDRAAGQGDLFGGDAVSKADSSWLAENVTPWQDAKRLLGEKTTLGLYLSGHPLDIFVAELAQLTSNTIEEVLEKKNHKDAVIVAGHVVRKRVLMTKRGQQMAIVTLEDQTGSMDITLFQDVYQSVQDHLDEPGVWLVDGRARHDSFNGRQQIVADRIQRLESWRVLKARCVTLRLSGLDEKISATLATILAPFRGGRCQVSVLYRGASDEAELTLGADWKVALKPQLLEQLQTQFGSTGVLVSY